MARRTFKLILIIALFVLFFATVVLVTWLTGTFVDLWSRLLTLPGWVQVLYLSLMALIMLAFGWLTWWLFRPGSRKLASKPGEGPQSLEALSERLEHAREEGVSTTDAERELEELKRRKQTGKIHVAMFGEISSGKSSLILTLIPDAEIRTGVAGGTTREAIEYAWKSPAGDELIIVDMPGLNEVDRVLDQLSTEEAERAHIVLFVTDGDITRSQFDALRALKATGKPLILVLNKSDWYSVQQLDQIRHSLEQHEELSGARVVITSAAGEETVTRVDASGNEKQVARSRPGDAAQLVTGLQHIIDSHREILDELRDASVFVLAGKKLDVAVEEERERRAVELVKSYATKAVVGGMAAITPGTDLVIQGVLGTRMVRELSELYDVPAREIDTQLLIELVQKQVGTTTTLILAVAGNGLKAFPGIGTVTGGLLHAVAYGMIFHALGHAVAESLRSRGALRPQVANTLFKERLEGEMKRTVKQYARLAYDQWKKSK